VIALAAVVIALAAVVIALNAVVIALNAAEFALVRLAKARRLSEPAPVPPND
jgi:hypothetical protein